MTEYLEEFKQNKLIFIHIPKFAGTSILNNLNDIDRKEMKLLCNIYSKDFKNFNYPKLLA